MKKVSFGFSYIELLVTLAILSLIVTAAMPVARTLEKRHDEAQLRQRLREVRSAIDAYKSASDSGLILKNENDSGYPKTLNDLVRGIPNQANQAKESIYFLRKIPADPMNKNTTLNPEDTWGKRSYDSTAEDPREGRDVFDVYSTSKEKGLNGTPYYLW
jgi:general secretion pathway protein G